MYISTNCTSAAMIMMNATYWRKGTLKGTRTKLYMGQVAAAVRVMTKVVASPMLSAFSVLFDTPTNGQMPKKYASTKLFTSAADMNISMSSIYIPCAAPSAASAAFAAFLLDMWF